MVYLLIVLIIWLVSLFFLSLGGALLFEYLKGAAQVELYTAAGSFALGLLLNFLVVNWPVEKLKEKKALDENTLKALKIMAKTAPIAPKAVKEGLEKIIQRYS